MSKIFIWVLYHQILCPFHGRGQNIKAQQQRLALLRNHPDQYLLMDFIYERIDIIYFLLAVGRQAQEGDPRIFRVLDPLEQLLLNQSLNDFGHPAFHHVHFLGDTFRRQVPLISKENKAAKFGFRKSESFALVLHPLLATLKQLRNHVFELPKMVIRDFFRDLFG